MAQSVARSVAQNMSAGERGIEVVAESAEASMPSQPATALALIINELVQNAVEHAFHGEPGLVKINIEGDGEYLTLEVRDSGFGLPPSFKPALDGNLGLDLVRTLAQDDLHGEFRMTSNGGTTATVRIPIRW